MIVQYSETLKKLQNLMVLSSKPVKLSPLKEREADYTIFKKQQKLPNGRVGKK